ncbi:MAG: adenylate/guanylate cyclase domain-containing protein [Bacteroidota bacterium]
MLETRKLAIIVFADIAGYSALMQADEKEALHVLDQFKSILEEEMNMHDGEIVQYYGDGCLLSFESAFHSVSAATSLQRAFIYAKVPVRIGMHLGDVLYKNNNAFGDGVNIASRVESLGVPGSILLSKTVANQIRNKSDFSLQNLGPFHFKNIDEPMEVFAISNPGFVIPRPDQMEGKLQKPKPKQEELANQSEWERYQMLEIMDALEDEKCVLILGNYAFSRPADTSGMNDSEFSIPELIMREQQKWANANSSESLADFYTAAQSLIGRAGGQRMFMELSDIKLKDLGNKQQERFKKISEIPFDLIVSTYPFNLLQEVFNKNKIAHNFDYYSFLEESGALEPFSAEKPLIYNLFGSVKHKDSMVISLDRLYQFIFGILGVRQLPKKIQDKVKQASHLVFLGFSFDAWYMKLLLRVLKVHEKEISYAHPPGPAGLRQQNRMFFESNFKVTFLNKKVDEFVSELHNHCERADMLRTASAEEIPTPYEQLQELTARYRLEEVMERLDEIILKNGKAGSLLRKLGDYQRRFHKIKEWENYETYGDEELEPMWEKLKTDVSLFIDLVSEMIPS